MAKTFGPERPAAAPELTDKNAVGRMVRYYAKGDTQPQAAVVQLLYAPVSGEPPRMDLFVFGVPSQGLAQVTAQRVPLYSGEVPERVKEWCEFV